MITSTALFNVILFFSALNIVVPTIDIPSTEAKIEYFNKEFDWIDFQQSNTVLYTHRDCPFIKEKSICCPDQITLNEPTLTNVCNRPIAHTCAIPLKKSIQKTCPECIYTIHIPTNYLSKIKKYMNDHRCNYTLPQHEYRKKRKMSLKSKM